MCGQPQHPLREGRLAAASLHAMHIMRPSCLQNYDATKEVVIASSDPYYSNLIPK